MITQASQETRLHDLKAFTLRGLSAGEYAFRVSGSPELVVLERIPRSKLPSTSKNSPK